MFQIPDLLSCKNAVYDPVSQGTFLVQPAIQEIAPGFILPVTFIIGRHLWDPHSSAGFQKMHSFHFLRQRPALCFQRY